MRIALDVRPLQNESGGRGVGRYVRALMTHLPALDDEYWYLESRWSRPGDFPPEAKGRRLRLVRPPRAITLFDQVATPLLCAWKKIDLVHSTFYAVPRLTARRAIRVITIHDLTPLRIPGSTSAKNTAIFREIYRSGRSADAVIVPSERTASDLVQEIGVEPSRIHVIPMGVGAPFGRVARPPEENARRIPSTAGEVEFPTPRPSSTRSASAAVAGKEGRPEAASGSRRFTEQGIPMVPDDARSGPVTAAVGMPPARPDPGDSAFAPIERLKASGARVLVYAGGFDATKNVGFLVDALDCMNPARVRLAIVGDPGRARAALERERPRHGTSYGSGDPLAREGIVFLGRLSDRDLSAAYRSANLFVSASLYEGFGLPALEAMACGCPVVALSSSAVREVLEGAAVQVEERDAEAFAAAVLDLLDDERRRSDLIARGLRRAASLPWDRTAASTHALYHELEKNR